VEELILTNKEIYQRADSDFFKGDEFSFQGICKQVLPDLLSKKNKKVNVFNFDLLLRSGWGNTKPDLFAFSDDYKYFAIIEVETSNHQLENHVMNQMRKITSAVLEYENRSIFKNLSDNNDSFGNFDLDKFSNMIKFIAPDYIVAVDHYIEHWQERLASLNVQLISISPYRNDLSNEIYHVKQLKKPKNVFYIDVSWHFSYFIIKESRKKFFINNANLNILLHDDEYFNFKVFEDNGEFSLHPFNNKKSIKKFNPVQFDILEIIDEKYRLISRGKE
jgi:hypothetical protein